MIDLRTEASEMKTGKRLVVIIIYLYSLLVSNYFAICSDRVYY